MKFYFDIDIRIFSNFLKIIYFSIDQKKVEKKIENFQNLKNRKFQNFKIWVLSLKIFDFLKILKIFTFSKIYELFFWSIKKIFFEEVEKNPDINIEVKFHCGSNGSSPSLWKPLQTCFLVPVSLFILFLKQILAYRVPPNEILWGSLSSPKKKCGA